MLLRSSRLIGSLCGLAAAMTGATLLLHWIEPGYLPGRDPIPDPRWLALARSAGVQARPQSPPPSEIEGVTLPPPDEGEGPSSLNEALGGAVQRTSAVPSSLSPDRRPRIPVGD